MCLCSFDRTFLFLCHAHTYAHVLLSASSCCILTDVLTHVSSTRNAGECFAFLVWNTQVEAIRNSSGRCSHSDADSRCQGSPGQTRSTRQGTRGISCATEEDIRTSSKEHPKCKGCPSSAHGTRQASNWRVVSSNGSSLHLERCV